MRRPQARSLFALGVIAVALLGAPLGLLVDRHDGPIFFVVGTILAGLIVELIFFIASPPNAADFPSSRQSKSLTEIQIKTLPLRVFAVHPHFYLPAHQACPGVNNREDAKNAK